MYTLIGFSGPSHKAAGPGQAFCLFQNKQFHPEMRILFHHYAQMCSPLTKFNLQSYRIEP